MSDTQYKCIEYKAAGAVRPGIFYELHTPELVIVNSQAELNALQTETRFRVIL